jgi:all-trans-8'-apo-beta-carotenal 15,15'-oxygenase
MVNTISPASWKQAFAQPGIEFGPVPLQTISGAIPTGLQGSFYRNGPALFERGGKPIEHWCDGDGAILGIHFNGTDATGVYRFVQTEAYQAETEANKFIFGSYGRTPKGPIWKEIGIPMKNAANNGVLALPDRLLALWEAGSPHTLELKNLTTLGLESGLGLDKDAPYSAHPKRDPKTGDIFNFGVSYGSKATLHLYRSNSTGKIEQQATVALDGLPLIHDFVLTEKYLVFFVPPVRLNLLPFLSKRKSFSDSLAWQPKKETQVLVIDRTTLSVVSSSKTEPWFQWRFGNGYVDTDNTVVVDVVRYEDFQIDQFLKQVPTGIPQPTPVGKLWQIRLDPHLGEVIKTSQLLDRGCEYPTIASHKLGQPWRYTYLSLHPAGVNVSSDLPTTIACFDRETGNLTEANLGDDCYPVSPIYAGDADNSDQGWILTEVFNGDLTEVWIFDAAHLDAEPVCKLVLPQVIPFGFHGTWQPI